MMLLKLLLFVISGVCARVLEGVNWLNPVSKGKADLQLNYEVSPDSICVIEGKMKGFYKFKETQMDLPINNDAEDYGYARLTFDQIELEFYQFVEGEGFSRACVKDGKGSRSRKPTCRVQLTAIRLYVDISTVKDPASGKLVTHCWVSRDEYAGNDYLNPTLVNPSTCPVKDQEQLLDFLKTKRLQYVETLTEKISGKMLQYSWQTCKVEINTPFSIGQFKGPNGSNGLALITSYGQNTS